MTLAEFARGSLLNLCVLLALVTLSAIVRGWFGRQHRPVPAWQMGFLFGLMASISMMFPIVTRSGLIFDCRSGVIGSAALLGGPITALASLPFPMVYRLRVGGPGLLPGLLEIVLPAIVGSICHLWFRHRHQVLSTSRIATAALLVAMGTVGPILIMVRLFIPDSIVSEASFIPVLLLLNVSVSMTILSSLIVLEIKHFDALHSIAESERRMLHSQKMAAIGQLARKVAHSFVNTLTIVLGNAQVAKDSANNPGEVRSHMDELIGAAGRLSYLTGELLAFANPTPTRMRPTELGKAVLGVRELLTKTIEPEMQVFIDADAKAGKVNMDPDQIGQAILHLAVNACEASTGYGRLMITTCPANLSERDLNRLQAGTHEKDRHRGDFALLSVADNGCGMDAETLGRIFEPFFTTKTDRQNAGLGLSSVYNIVQLHNGHIDVISSPGQGTTFLIYLPVVDEAG